MKVEARRLDIDKVFPGDPLTWAKNAQIHSEWLQEAGPQLGLDTHKLILGHVLAVIIGDDANCFVWYEVGAPFELEWAESSRARLLFRLDWEINTPELPNRIKERLEEVREAVEPLDWSSEESFKKVMKIWYSAKDWVVEEIYKTPKLKEAVKYELEKSQILSELYEKTISEVPQGNIQD